MRDGGMRVAGWVHPSKASVILSGSESASGSRRTSELGTTPALATGPDTRPAKAGGTGVCHAPPRQSTRVPSSEVLRLPLADSLPLRMTERRGRHPSRIPHPASRHPTPPPTSPRFRRRLGSSAVSNPSNGRNAHTANTCTMLVRSASLPSTAEPMPPMPKAKPKKQPRNRVLPCPARVPARRRGLPRTPTPGSTRSPPRAPPSILTRRAAGSA